MNDEDDDSGSSFNDELMMESIKQSLLVLNKILELIKLQEEEV